MSTQCRYSDTSGFNAVSSRGRRTGAPAATAVLEGWLKPGWLRNVPAEYFPISILVVHGESSPLGTLTEILTEQFSAAVTRARNCHEARLVLEETVLPHVVFTDTKLVDGSWEDILTMTGKASQAMNALVVSLVGNIVLYTEAMTRGAFDFITPNIPPAAFVEVLRNAVEDVERRRSSRQAA